MLNLRWIDRGWKVGDGTIAGKIQYPKKVWRLIPLLAIKNFIDEDEDYYDPCGRYEQYYL